MQDEQLEQMIAALPAARPSEALDRRVMGELQAPRRRGRPTLALAACLGAAVSFPVGFLSAAVLMDRAPTGTGSIASAGRRPGDGSMREP